MRIEDRRSRIEDPDISILDPRSSILGTFRAFRWRTDESDDTVPYSHHGYAYALSDPVLLTDPSGRCAEPGRGDDYCHTDSAQTDPRDLTDWLYREMRADLDDAHLQVVRQTNKLGHTNVAISCILNPITPFLALAAYGRAAERFYQLVKDHGPFDVKHRIKERLGLGVTLCSRDRCHSNIESSVIGNILFGFIAREAGYSGLIIQAGAGRAEATDPSHDPEEARARGVVYLGPYDPAGKFYVVVSLDGVDVNLGDDPPDNAAVAFGMRLYNRYGRSLTLDVFKQELAPIVPKLATHVPDAIPVRPDVANKWPYDVGYFDPTVAP